MGLKARVKATGEIVEVTRIVDRYVMTHHPHAITFEKDELDFDIEDELDYWERLEHQYAGMAMQTMLATLYNPKYHKELMACYTEVDAEEVARLSKYYAHALVEKMKEERK